MSKRHAKKTELVESVTRKRVEKYQEINLS